MKRIFVLAAVVSAFMSAPAFAKGQGIGIGANVLTGRGGVMGLLDGRGALVVNTSVTTGKNGVLGAVLGRSHALGGLLGGGCGCHYVDGRRTGQPRPHAAAAEPFFDLDETAEKRFVIDDVTTRPFK
jgi:hypothetical protein